MLRYFEIVERDHELQNPTSPGKIRLLGEYLRLGRESRVLDVACGKCGPARILAGDFGCRVEGIELSGVFSQEARQRNAAAALDSLIEVRTADAAATQLEPEAFDVALCLGASFVWGNIAGAAAALRVAVPEGGLVAIGEPFWRQWPLPGGVEDLGFVDLEGTVARLEQAGFHLTGMIAASEDDWDRYESLHWRAAEEWLSDGPHAEAEEVRAMQERMRRDYLRFQRALLGWAIFVGRKTTLP